jgi:hypothetical protein
LCVQASLNAWPLPLGVSPDNGFDMRDPADYPRQVRFAAWDGDHALIKRGLKDLGDDLHLLVPRELSWLRGEKGRRLADRPLTPAPVSRSRFSDKRLFPGTVASSQYLRAHSSS